MRVLRKRNILSFILAFVMTVCVLPVLSKEPVMAASAKEEAAYQKIIAMKEKYPEGTKWGNGKEYKGKTACQAFAFMMSDIAYGESAKFYSHNDFGALKTGDIIFQAPYTTTSDGASTSGTHALVVEIADYDNDRLVVCEGNFAGKVHWDAELTISEFAMRCGDSVVSRIKYKENHPVSIERPAKQSKVKYKYENGTGYFYAKETECTGYQFLCSDIKSFPYTNTHAYYNLSPQNYVYWQGTKEDWGPGYVKVRSFNVSGGHVSYGKWGKTKKIAKL